LTNCNGPAGRGGRCISEKPVIISSTSLRELLEAQSKLQQELDFFPGVSLKIGKIEGWENWR